MENTVNLRKKNESVPAEKLEPPTVEHISWVTNLNHPPNKKAAFIVVVIVVIGAGAAIYLGQDFLFALVLVLTGIVFVALSFRKLSRDSIRLDALSLTVSERRYLLSEFKSFWIDYRPPQIKELSLEFKKLYIPMLRIPIEDTDPLKIRAIMLLLLPEKEYRESLIDQLIRQLNR